jgi:hypothetical protein
MRIFIISTLLSLSLFGEIFRDENKEEFFIKNHIFIGWLEKSYSYDEIRAYGKYIEAMYPAQKTQYAEYIDYLAFLDFEEKFLKRKEKR